MSDWQDQYLSALVRRDQREQAHKPYIDAFTKLADSSYLANDTPQPSQLSTLVVPNTTTTRGTPSKTSETPQDATTLANLRADLASTQKARSTLTTSLQETTTTLSQLETAYKTLQQQATLLSRQRTEAERKLRDRDEELRGKDEMVGRVQDEMIALGLQLHMAEEGRDKLRKENEDLVARWMRRMGEEAESMNRDSRWE